MSEIKNKFRASSGLDAAGEKIINVALADRTVLSDGVNVAYLIQENTIQNFNNLRTYTSGFAVLYNNRVWISKQNILAGSFNEAQWDNLRTDPKWITVASGIRSLNSGDYLVLDTISGLPIELTLPSNAQDGDTIVVKDLGGNTGYSDVLFKSGQQSIHDKGQKLVQTKMTVPYSEYVFVYANRLWNLYNWSEATVSKKSTTNGINYLQSGDTIVCNYDKQEPINFKFPKNANNGDVINFIGTTYQNTLTFYNNVELNSFDADTSVVSSGLKTITYTKELNGSFVFNSLTSTWEFFETNKNPKAKLVNSNTNLFPDDKIIVTGGLNATLQNIVLTLPTNVDFGNEITISTRYIKRGQTVKIACSGTDKIVSDKNLLQYPKRSTYPADSIPESIDLTFSGGNDYSPTITLAYTKGATYNKWYVSETLSSIERVDPTSDATRARLGVIALATQNEANLNHENITAAAKEVAITPETLANRTANETRRGIARIATSAEVNLTTDNASLLDDVIITPKKLNGKQSTETMRGVAEIATQAEANSTTDDSRIITAKKLTARQAIETMKGVAYVVAANGTQNADRSTAGAGVFDFNDHEKIVTPKVLREFKASETSQGGGFLATSTEVIAGTTNPVGIPLLVTPETLHTKTATEARIGFTEIATQVETNAGIDDFRFITPKKLAARASTETMTGVVRIGTQIEFNAGVLDNVFSSPLKIKTFFNSQTRTSINAVSGLVESGTLWTTHALDIKQSTETQRGTLAVATQTQTNAGVDDLTAVTPKKLHAKKSTESAEGIIQVATAVETTAGVIANKSVSPKNLLNTIQIDTTWEATSTRRGTVKISENSLTFVGNDVVGNTQALNLYQKTGYAVSPYELNKTLANYLPLKAKAVDSDKLDGIDSTQFIRRDINQTVNGELTLTKITKTVDVSSTGIVTIGDVSKSALGVEKDRLVLENPNYPASWVHSTIDNASTAEYKIRRGDKNVLTLSANTTIASVNIDGNMSVSGTITGSSDVSFTKNLVVGGTLTVGGQLALQQLSGSTYVSNTTSPTVIRTNDANTLKVQDIGAIYDVLTTKNMDAKLDGRYVNASGDAMSGRLTVNSPFVSTIAPASAPISTVPSATNFGTWVTDVLSATQYNLLPGYVVGVPDINQENKEPTGYINRYDEFKGPGTLSQFGSSSTSGAGTYQIWAPRPTTTNVAKDGHNAQTFWMRSWNATNSKWDGWGRIYTSNNPPTAKDIGAMSDNGSVFSSMRIRDWIQVGNLRIFADPTTKSVRFDWID